jgi:excisionase family DNA binding protein
MENGYDKDLTKQTDDRKILTLQEVSEILRVHRSTISRYAKSGELKSYQIGNRRLFKSDDVWSFFENQVALEYVSGKEEC